MNTVGIIAFFGDFFMNHRLYCEAHNRSWANSTHVSVGYDLGVVNFEGSLARDIPPSKQTILQSAPEAVDILKEARIGAVCLANNHIGDGGLGSVAATRSFLESRGIQCFGAGANLCEARKPVIIQLASHRIALLGYCSSEKHVGGIAATAKTEGVAPIDVALVADDIRLLRSRGNADTIVVYLHWGKEYRRIPAPEERAVAHHLRSLGVDLVIGAHPHVPRSYEQTDRIYYSLGNFVFPEIRCVDGAYLRWDFISRTGLSVIGEIRDGQLALQPKVFAIDRCGLPLTSKRVHPWQRRLAGAVEFTPQTAWRAAITLRLDDLFWRTRRLALWRWNEIIAVGLRRLRGRRYK